MAKTYKNIYDIPSSKNTSLYSTYITRFIKEVVIPAKETAYENRQHTFEVLIPQCINVQNGKPLDHLEIHPQYNLLKEHHAIESVGIKTNTQTGEATLVASFIR